MVVVIARYLTAVGYQLFTYRVCDDLEKILDHMMTAGLLLLLLYGSTTVDKGLREAFIGVLFTCCVDM
jgi:hypothetical protein